MKNSLRRHFSLRRASFQLAQIPSARKARARRKGGAERLVSVSNS